MYGPGKRQIGGAGLIVELDETFLRRRKRGGHGTKPRPAPGELICIFGIYCRETKEFFFLRVDNKSRRVLWAQIRHYVHKKSKIVTDGLASYLNLGLMGYEGQERVNHTYEFVNSTNDEIHINNIENRNRWLKETIKSCRDWDQLDAYCCEYKWKSEYLKDAMEEKLKPGVMLKTFLEMAKKVYPGIGKEVPVKQVLQQDPLDLDNLDDLEIQDIPENAILDIEIDN